MRVSALVVALRLAWRDARRNAGRSVLVVALIGLPILSLAAADVAYRTLQLDPAERITREIGAADAGVQPMEGPVEQTPNAWLGAPQTAQGRTLAQPATLDRLLQELPAGTRAVSMLQSNAPLRLRTADGLADSELVGLDLRDRVTSGLVGAVQGRLPADAHQLAITPALARATGLHTGDVARTVDGRSYTVTALVSPIDRRDAERAYVLPAALPSGSTSATWLLDTPDAVTWQRVIALNTLGYLVLSRTAYLDPPPASQVPYRSQSGDAVPRAVFASAVLIAGMALVEVALLAGPAFAAGARRQRRELALIAAAGGDRAHLRAIVLANGLVLGAIAGVVGIVGGVLGGTGAVPPLARRVDQVPGHWDVRPLDLAVIALVGVGTALLAALIPAVQAARSDVVAGLAGRRGTTRTHGAVPVLGLGVAAFGAVITLLLGVRSVSAQTVLAGVAITELGLIMCTPALLGVIGRLGGALPVPARIALRDAARNRGVAASAVAAVMAAIIGAVGIAVAATSHVDAARRGYTAALPPGATFVDSATSASVSPRTAAAVGAALHSVAPAADIAVVRAPGDPCRDATVPVCTSTVLDIDRQTPVPSRFRSNALGLVLVDDGSGVDALFGTHVPQAAAALRAGRVIVPDSAALHDGRLRLQLIRRTSSRNDTTAADRPVATLDVPATVIASGYPAAAVIVPPSVVRRVSSVDTVGVLAAGHRLTDKQSQELRAALRRIDPNLETTVERGFHDDTTTRLWGLVLAAAVIALAAAVIATALADTDGRPDLVTLAAVGAAPRTRRLVSTARAGVVAGIGCLIGGLAGFLPAAGYVLAVARTAGVEPTEHWLGDSPEPRLHLVVPWSTVALLVVGVPLCAMIIGAAVSRSRLPVERAAD